MSKYKEGEAGPLEYYLYDTVAPIVGTFMYEKLGMTPNIVTTFRFCLGLYVVRLIHTKKYTLGAVLWFIQNCLDGIDGYIARKYNISTEFGAWYDTTSDDILTALVGFVILQKYNVNTPAKIVSLLIFIYMYFGNPVKQRVACIHHKNKCADKLIRHEVLSRTLQYSGVELSLLVSIVIYFIPYYHKIK